MNENTMIGLSKDEVETLYSEGELLINHDVIGKIHLYVDLPWCTHCQGTGVIASWDDNTPIIYKCPHCNKYETDMEAWLACKPTEEPLDEDMKAHMEDYWKDSKLLGTDTHQTEALEDEYLQLDDYDEDTYVVNSPESIADERQALEDEFQKAISGEEEPQMFKVGDKVISTSEFTNRAVRTITNAKKIEGGWWYNTPVSGHNTAIEKNGGLRFATKEEIKEEKRRLQNVKINNVKKQVNECWIKFSQTTGADNELKVLEEYKGLLLKQKELEAQIDEIVYHETVPKNGVTIEDIFPMEDY